MNAVQLVPIQLQIISQSQGYTSRITIHTLTIGHFDDEYAFDNE